MKRFFYFLVICALVASTALAQTRSKNAQVKDVTDPLAQRFVSDFELPTAAQEAEARMQRNAGDATALFVRMETAELQERPELVLDSALRLCALPAASTLQEVAANRVLEHAANTRAFNA